MMTKHNIVKKCYSCGEEINSRLMSLSLISECERAGCENWFHDSMGDYDMKIEEEYGEHTGRDCYRVDPYGNIVCEKHEGIYCEECDTKVFQEDIHICNNIYNECVFFRIEREHYFTVEKTTSDMKYSNYKATSIKCRFCTTRLITFEKSEVY